MSPLDAVGISPYVCVLVLTLRLLDYSVCYLNPVITNHSRVTRFTNNSFSFSFFPSLAQNPGWWPVFKVCLFCVRQVRMMASLMTSYTYLSVLFVPGRSRLLVYYCSLRTAARCHRYLVLLVLRRSYPVPVLPIFRIQLHDPIFCIFLCSRLVVG